MKATLFTFHIGNGEKVLIVRERFMDALRAVPVCLQERIESVDDEPVTLSRL